MQRILSFMRKAIEDYGMIDDGDTVAVGVSGGKDSMLLLAALAEFRRFSPKRFTLVAINIDMGFEDSNPEEYQKIVDFAEKIDVPFIREKTEIGAVLFDIRKEKNPCSLCAKMRRGALCGKCAELGATKLALAHHADDLLETVLLSFTYESRLAAFSPKSLMAKTGITVIRPFLYIEEKDVTETVKRLSIPTAKNPCPANHYTRREYMKNLVKTLDKDMKGAKRNMLSAILHPERNNLDAYKKS